MSFKDKVEFGHWPSRYFKTVSTLHVLALDFKGKDGFSSKTPFISLFTEGRFPKVEFVSAFNIHDNADRAIHKAEYEAPWWN